MATVGPHGTPRGGAWYLPVDVIHEFYAQSFRRIVELEGLKMTQVSGTNPTLYTNYKKKGAKKAPKK